MRKECARVALEAGSMLTGEKLPADGVIMAGVVTHGKSTVHELEMIAGIAAPVYEGRARKQGNVIGKPCLNCGRTLHGWTRTPEDIPPGMVMHYSRQFCVDCRTALQAYLDSLPEEERRVRRGLMKVVDRKRHHHGREAQLKRRHYINRKRKEIAVELGVPVDYIVPLKDAAKCLGFTKGKTKSRATKSGALWRMDRSPYCKGANLHVNLGAFGYESPLVQEREAKSRAKAAEELCVPVTEVVNVEYVSEMHGLTVSEMLTRLHGRGVEVVNKWGRHWLVESDVPSL